MKNKDLIEILQQYPEDAEILVTNSNTMEQRGDKPATHVVLSEEGSVNTRTTRDAFDGGVYSYEEWSTVGGDKNVIKIS